MSYRKLFQVEPGSKAKLSEIDPAFTAKHKNKASAAADLEKYTQKLRELQYLLYAEGKRSLLICLQALDAAGKDGTINHVLGNMNPQGTRVHGFKVPSKEEAAHDFLWRIHTADAGQRRSGHLQPLALRRRARGARPQPRARGRLVEALRSDQRLREGPRCQRHAHHQVLPSHQPGRAAPALQAAARRPGPPLEDQRGDYAERELWPQYTQAYEDALRRPAPSTRRGTSFPRITSGSGTWPSPRSSWKPWNR